MKVFELPEIGNVQITKRSNSRSFKLRVDQCGEIRMSIPSSISYKKALAFVEKHAKWIIENKNKVASQTNAVKFQFNKTYRSLMYDFSVITSNNKNITFRQAGRKHFIFVPQDTDQRNPKIQAFIEKKYLALLRTEANMYLPTRLRELADKYNFTINQVRIKNQRSRWGSCSSAMNINLNMHLVRLPENLIDHVLIHELCHTIHQNHSRNFYALLHSIIPAYKEESRVLSTYRLSEYFSMD